MGSSARDVIDVLLGYDVMILFFCVIVISLSLIGCCCFRCGAKTTVKNEKGQTPYDLAVELGYDSLAKSMGATLGQNALGKLTKPKTTFQDDF